MSISKTPGKTNLLILTLWFIFITAIHSQSQNIISLDSCYKWVQNNYPLTRQNDLLKNINELTLENISTGNLPRLQLGGQATYQSDVTKIPVMIPGSDIPSISKDQYKLYGEITQSLTEYKTIRRKADLIKTEHSIQQKELDITLRELKNRVNSLFFGILLLDEQIEQNQITKANIDRGIQRLNTALKYGTVLPSDVDQLKVELLQLDQQIYTLGSRKNALIQMLSLMTGHSLDQNDDYKKPIIPNQPADLMRPELDLFSLQQSQIIQQRSLYHQQMTPRLSLFLQGGFGRPALNFLDNDFSGYYVGGLRFQWNISGYYTRQRKDQIWDIQQRSIDLKAETFKLNAQVKLGIYDEEIQRYQNLIRSDDDIIALRTSIKNTAENQLAQGIITPLDFLSFVYNEDKARQSKTLHEIQLLQASYNWLYENGN